MDGTGKEGGEDLQIREHGLDKKTKNKEAREGHLLFGVDHTVGLLGSFTSRAGVDRRTWVDWTTSAAWMLLW